MNKKISLSISLLLMVWLTMNAQIANPKADPKAIVFADQARFTILTPQMIRLEYDEKGVFEDKASFVFINRNLRVPKYSVENAGAWLVIKTSDLVLRYKKKSGKFNKNNLSIQFSLNGKKTNWFPGLKDSLNLKGTTRTLDNATGDPGTTPQLEDGLLSRSGWSFIDDSNNLLFDGSTDWNWVTSRVTGNHQDFYFMGYGHDYKTALLDYTQVAGKIPMPPKYAFGYWWSRYWTYSDDELRNLIGDFKKYNIPSDILIIDMDWHNTWGLDYKWKQDVFGQPIGWTGYTWNKNLFPEPEKFLAWTKTQGLKTALNLHPASGIAPMERQYNDFAKAYGFDTTLHQNIPFAMEDKKWAKTYFDIMLHPIQQQGVDFWWLDWQQWLESKTIKGLSNTWWLNYTFFTDMERRGKTRPFLFHRWGGLGNHRYQIGFSGDALSSWNMLAYEPYFTATASNVGYGYWSHDIGGHVASDPDPELYLRWIQFGVFSPILRTHCSKSALNERRIWKFPNQYKMMLQAYKLRYTLNPYIYKASREAYEKGISICRPMYYDYPEAEMAYANTGQYMFGDDMIVSPITAKADTLAGLSLKKIWLPKGEWYDFFAGAMLHGNQIVSRKYSLQEVPVFVKAGSIIPMIPDVPNLQNRVDTLVLTVIPGGNGNTQVYEDDGISDAYQSNHFTTTAVGNVKTGDGISVLTISPRLGTFDGMSESRYYEIRYPTTFPPATVTVNGKKYTYSPKAENGAWTYNGSTLSTIVSIPLTSCKENVEVKITQSENTHGKDNLLDNKAGLFTQIALAAENMKYESARVDWVANMPDCLMEMATIPSRIQYHPEQIVWLLEKLTAELKPCVQLLENYPAHNEAILQKITEPLVINNDSFCILPKPKVMLSKTISEKPETLQIFSDIKNAVIRYTLDGSLPVESSAIYNAPLVLSRSSLIRARTFRKRDLSSFTEAVQYSRLMAKDVTYTHSAHPSYSGGSKNALIDGMVGELSNVKDHWIGFNGDDMIATIELRTNELNSITTRFMQFQDIWVFLPTHIQYETSSDGVNYKTIYEKDISTNEHGDKGIFEFKADVKQKNIQFIRVTAKNLGMCPSWHQGAGQKAWLFTDELILE